MNIGIKFQDPENDMADIISAGYAWLQLVKMSYSELSNNDLNITGFDDKVGEITKCNKTHLPTYSGAGEIPRLFDKAYCPPNNVSFINRNGEGGTQTQLFVYP